MPSNVLMKPYPWRKGHQTPLRKGILLVWQSPTITKASLN
jgi:hypothetical protein